MRHDPAGRDICVGFGFALGLGLWVSLSDIVEYRTFRINHRKSYYHIPLSPETPPLRASAPAATSGPNP